MQQYFLPSLLAAGLLLIGDAAQAPSPQSISQSIPIVAETDNLQTARLQKTQVQALNLPKRQVRQAQKAQASDKSAEKTRNKSQNGRTQKRPSSRSKTQSPKKAQSKAKSKAAKASERELPFWFFEWRLFGKSSLADWQKILEASPDLGDETLHLYLRLDSPTYRLNAKGQASNQTQGKVQIRAQIPLWKNDPAAGYPPEWPQNSAYENGSSELAQQLKARLTSSLYQSQVYFSWWHANHKLQLGSIQMRSDSPWYSLSSTSVFPSSTESIASMPSTANGQNGRNGKNAASNNFVRYEPELGLGQTWGLSWDHRIFHALLLHKRNSSAENLQLGLALSFAKESTAPKQKKAQAPQAPKTQSKIQLRTAALLSQNLSKKSSDDPWYFAHTGQMQNSAYYDATERWPRLLRLDQALQQYYLHAAWSTEKAYRKDNTSVQSLNSKIHLATEQSASLSSLDYLGLRQQYYLKFQVPIFYSKQSNEADELGKANKTKEQSQPKKTSKSTATNFSSRDFGIKLNNELFASYADPNWVDARRKLASSQSAQFHAQRLSIKNQSSLYFFRSHKYRPEIALIPPSTKILMGRTHEQLYRLNLRIDTAHFLQNAQKSYYTWQAKYFLVWRKNYQNRANTVSALSLGLELNENIPSEIEPGTDHLHQTTWDRKLQLEFSAQQKPPSKIPTQLSTKLSTKPTRKPQPEFSTQKMPLASKLTMGWKATAELKESELSEPFSLEIWRRYTGAPLGQAQLEAQFEAQFEAKLQSTIFMAIWHYGDFSQKKKIRKGWWKFFQLQLDLSLRLHFDKPSDYTVQNNIADLANFELQGKLNMLVQLAKNWQFRFGIALENWPLESNAAGLNANLSEKLSLQFSIRYQSHKSVKANKKSRALEVGAHSPKETKSTVQNDDLEEEISQSFETFTEEEPLFDDE